MSYSQVQNKQVLSVLPNTWEVIEYNKIIEDDTKNAKKIKKQDYLEAGPVCIVDQGQQLISGYSDDITNAYKDYPVIIFGDHTRYFKYVDFPFNLGADGTKILRVKKMNVNVKYIFYYLKTLNIPDTGYNRHYKFIKNILIPMPPFKVQEKIVEVLDNIQDLINKRKEQIEKLDEFLQSVFFDMFGDPVANTKVWNKEKFKDICINHDSKRIPIKEDERQKGSFPYYGATGIIDYVKDYIFDGTYLLIAEDGKNLRKRSKPVAFVARGRFWVNNHAHIVTSNGKVNLIYLLYFIENIDLEPFITGIDQFKLNKSNLERIDILIPPIELQNKFAQIVEQADQQKEQMQKSLTEMENLFNSIMQKAFKGELFN